MSTQSSITSFFGSKNIQSNLSNLSKQPKPSSFKDFHKDRIFGSHLSRSAGYIEAAKRAKGLKFDCFQIFFDNGFGSKFFDKKDAENTCEYLNETGIKLFIHSPYVINLCRGDKYVTDMLLQNLMQCHIIGSRGCVVHVGKLNTTNGKITEDVGMLQFKQNVDMVIHKMLSKHPHSGVKLLIETAAGQGSECPVSVEGLKQLYDSLEESTKPHVGFCVDTCHVFASGVCDFRKQKALDNFIEKWEELIGWEKVDLVHFNDSKCDFGSKKDRHESMGKGFASYDVLLNFQNFCADKKIPMVLEYDWRKHPDANMP